MASERLHALNRGIIIWIVAALLILSCSPSNPADSYEVEIVGSDNSEILEGTLTGEKLVGLAGGDLLKGNGGADMFVGGTGEDLLLGGTDADTYVFAVGDGPDIIEDAGGDHDRIMFTGGTKSDDVRFTEEAAGLRVSTPNARDSILILGWGNEKHSIERFVFADGELQPDEVESRISGNRRPQAEMEYPPQIARVGENFKLVLSKNTFSDPNPGDVLKYSIEPRGKYTVLNWMKVDFQNLELSGTPGKGDVGEFLIHFNGTDQGYLEATVELSISVVEKLSF